MRPSLSALLRPPTSSNTTSRRLISSVQHIQRLNATVNALVHVSDIPRPTRHDGALHGMTIAIKDNICTVSLPTACASAMLAEYMSPFDAKAVELLHSAGAHIIGKANCDEFGMGSLNVNSVHGPVVNPHQAPNETGIPWTNREQRSAGGSSGGSAASVAAGMCDAALGTDTGGSMRLPASYCGVAGFKPSYGLISRWGVISFADSLDCVGVFAKSVDGVKQVFDVISVHDARDPTAASPELRKRGSLLAETSSMQIFSSVQPGSLKGLRIGIPQEYFPLELEPDITHSLRVVICGLKDAGASIRSVSLPATQYALSAYYVIASAEASSNLARYDGIQYGLRVPLPSGTSRSKPSNTYAHSRSSGFGPEVQKRILLGTYALTADAFDNYFLQAQRVRNSIKADFNRVFRCSSVLLSASAPSPSTDGVDVLLHPSAIRTAPRLADKGSKGSDTSSIDAYLQDVMTVPASLAGLPALSVPIGLGNDGWPVGMSVVGQWGMDELVLRVGRVIQQLV